MFIYPVSRYLKITQIYWANHLGLDFGWNDGAFNGQPIVAIGDGKVVGCADGYGNTYPSRRIYGNYVNIDHGNGVYSMYAHLAKGIQVKKGDVVKQGQTLGLMGNSGYSNGQHLHFEYRKGLNLKSSSIDPMDYLYVADPTIYVNPNSKWYDRIQYANTAIITPVERNTNVDQVEVALDILNVRTEPTTSSKRLGYAPRGYYNVLQTAENGGYRWFNVEDGKWIAEVKNVFYLPKEAPHIYKVTFPYVSNGDKEYLLGVAAEKELECEVSFVS